MGISGVGSNPYNYNKMQHTNSGETNNGTAASMAMGSTSHLLHVGSEESEDGKALGLIGFPDGSSTSVFKGKEYTTDHPVYNVKTWDAEGNVTETEIDASKVDPSNASLQEMMAWNANRRLNGERSYEDELMMLSGRLHGDETSSGYGDFFTKTNWISEFEDFMKMQYQLGNMDGYFRYKQACDMLRYISDSVSKLGDAANKTDTKSKFSEMVKQYTKEVKDKIENGDTEPTFQIGSQTFTVKEWDNFLEKLDDTIDAMKEEVEEKVKESEKEKEEEKIQQELIAELLRNR